MKAFTTADFDRDIAKLDGEMLGDPLITLTTDFGYKDPFVGMMKGVILGINPAARIVDVTHGISPHNIMEAALTTGESHRYFPQMSIHLVVVDPGVGSERRPVLVEAGEHFFVGPDNGVFSDIYRSYSDSRVIHITEESYFLQSPGNTFHGRDVFAPVAAWLSRGTRPESLGEPITDYITLPIPEPSIKDDEVNGEVLYMDSFGNAITNIKKENLEGVCKRARPPATGAQPPATGPLAEATGSCDLSFLKVLVKDIHARLVSYYAEGSRAAPHAPYSLINSNGSLEIFVYKGSASEAFNITPGDSVTVVAQ